MPGYYQLMSGDVICIDFIVSIRRSLSYPDNWTISLANGDMFYNVNSRDINELKRIIIGSNYKELETMLSREGIN